jgi:hypothetical protein
MSGSPASTDFCNKAGQNRKYDYQVSPQNRTFNPAPLPPQVDSSVLPLMLKLKSSYFLQPGEAVFAID